MTDQQPNGRPVAVQLGFAGSRRLFDDSIPPAQIPTLEKQLVVQLRQQIEGLRNPLGLQPDQSFCGISQVAIGADLAFAEALANGGYTHRVFLPQPREDFLNAQEESVPDFTAEEKQVALAALERDNVIEERVVTAAEIREDRFEETSLAILDASDAALSLIRHDVDLNVRRLGGTALFIAHTQTRKMPLLLLRVHVVDGQIELTSELFVSPG
ncbi:hypothetical protein LOC68_10575 [Blastopirellula sp. JC732]|uniref:Uncharacterized protein n=1 Tax=Blastopirellula sediminis TaxID=2894196 RepID=A0A9X1SFZ0_9BACT|nr:hypothetical protein [Blastopirellula sediminis]MCC9608380.1 hypothetical protein [Blastopirellula sediminis]MCC9628843.1 hypothetical protein [Blastopirellula sediminis]